MHCRVAARRPARSTRNVGRVIDIPDVKSPGRRRVLHLRMATEAKIVVPLRQHLVVDGAVRHVAGRASVAQRFVLINVRLGLLAMALGASVIEPRHRQASAGGLHDVRTVRIVALHAVHLALQHGMVLGKTQLSVNLQVAGQARLRIASWIDDEPPAPPTHRDVFAARAMAGFAACLVLHRCALKEDPRMRAGSKFAHIVRVTFVTRLVAGKRGAFDHRRLHHRPLHRRAGNQNYGRDSDEREQTNGKPAAVHNRGNNRREAAEPEDAIRFIFSGGMPEMLAKPCRALQAYLSRYGRTRSETTLRLTSRRTRASPR